MILLSLGNYWSVIQLKSNVWDGLKNEGGGGKHSIIMDQKT